MFDFENTPITDYTRLKAQWNCDGGASGPLTYDGDWARITLTDGTKIECENLTGLSNLAAMNSPQVINGRTVAPAEVKKVEMGTKVTTFPLNNASAFDLSYFTNLEQFSGFHEGITRIYNGLFNNTFGTYTKELDFTLVLPSTLTSVGTNTTFPFLAANNFVGTVIVNCPMSAFKPPSNLMMAVTDPTAPAYTKGIRIMGAYANEFIAKYPNLNGPTFYRNLYNGNSLEGFKEALENGTASEIFPAGTEFPDLWNNQENPLIVAQYLDSSNNSSYGGAEGVILVRKYVEPTSQLFSSTTSDYSESSIKNLLDTTYYNNCSSTLKSLISDINIPYYNGSSMTSVPSKWFLMSAYEVCSQNEYGTTGYEGIMWDYWKQKTGLSAPAAVATSNNGRIMYDRSSTAQNVWLRSRFYSQFNNTFICYVFTNGSVNDSTRGLARSVLPACFIANPTPEASTQASNTTPERITDNITEEQG